MLDYLSIYKEFTNNVNNSDSPETQTLHFKKLIKNYIQYHISQRLHDMRKISGYSQSKIADKIGTNIQTIKSWENQAIIGSDKTYTLPSIEHIFLLAGLYGCTPSYLLCETDEKLPEQEYIRNNYGITEESSHILFDMMQKASGSNMVYIRFINQFLQNNDELIVLLMEQSRLQQLKSDLENDIDKKDIISCYNMINKNDPLFSFPDELRISSIFSNHVNSYYKKKQKISKNITDEQKLSLQEKLHYYWPILSVRKQQEISFSLAKYFTDFVEEFFANESQNIPNEMASGNENVESVSFEQIIK